MTILRMLCVTAMSASLTACLQPVVHATRVESGLELNYANSIHLALDSVGGYKRSDRSGIGVAFGAAVALRNASEDGVSPRLSFGTGTTGLYAGGYFEVPRSWFGDWDAGIGTTVFFSGLNAVMPYVQAGFQATEEIAPLVSFGAYVMQDDIVKRVRPALTLGASLHAPPGRRVSAGGILYSTILFNASKLRGASCPVDCGNDAFLSGTYLILGFASSLRLVPPGDRAISPDPVPARR